MSLTALEEAWKSWGFVWAGVGKYTITCVECGCVEEARYHSSKPPNNKVKALKNLGWVLREGRNPICPNCRRSAKKELKENNDMTLGPSIEITIDVAELLRDVFDKSTGLYKEPWDDVTVAKKIGTSETIVIDIRKKRFGELAIDPAFKRDVDAAVALFNEETSKIQNQISMISMEFGNIRKDQTAFEERMTTKINDLTANLNTLKATTADIDGKLRDLAVKPSELKARFEAEFGKLLGKKSRAS